MKKSLRHGYTTGACAAAAARGAALMLREQRLVHEAEIVLPDGEHAVFMLHSQAFGECSASCHVVKDAGDDPDITNGAEIHASIEIEPSPEGSIRVTGGVGVGRVTKPGLAVPVGESAINPVPRRMIIEAVREVSAVQPAQSVTVTISIPYGEELAKKTLNERLGIIGGLSILGTTGIVKPVSAKAWTDTIDCSVAVALASGTETVVLSTGRTSERAAQQVLGGILPEEAFIMMGDHVGYALRSCKDRGVTKVVLAGQFAKLLKIGCGHQQTHVSSSELDLRELAGWCGECAGTVRFETLCRVANTARHVLIDSEYDAALISLVCGKARSAALQIASELKVSVLLAGYDGEVLYFA